MQISVLHDWIFNQNHPEFSLMEMIQLLGTVKVSTIGHNDSAAFLAHSVSYFNSLNIGKDRSQVWNYIHDFPEFMKKFQPENFDLVISNTRGPMNWVKKSKWQDSGGVYQISYAHDSYADIYLGYDRPFGNFWSSFTEEDRYEYQRLDLEYMQGVDLMIASSELAARKIRRDYEMEVRVVNFPLPENLRMRKENRPPEQFLAWGFFDRSNCLEHLINVFNHLPQKLVFIGEGEGKEDWESKCEPNIKLLNPQSWSELDWYLDRSYAVLTAEPFKIHPLPAAAAARGLPLISYINGCGAEYIEPAVTGLVYNENSADGLAQALFQFLDSTWEADEIMRHYERKYVNKFRDAFKEELDIHLPNSKAVEFKTG